MNETHVVSINTMLFTPGINMHHYVMRFLQALMTGFQKIVNDMTDLLNALIR